jgi:hypothetical protein
LVPHLDVKPIINKILLSGYRNLTTSRPSTLQQSNSHNNTISHQQSDKLTFVENAPHKQANEAVPPKIMLSNMKHKW